jgi:hypothetical protein
MCTKKDLKDVLFHHANIGVSHSAEMSALGHRGDVQIAVEHEVAMGGLWEVEMNLRGMTMGVPPLRR